ncbi:phosphomannomutase/phosphoglucomutase [Marinospirillum alkaliphilum]|uniref:phosphomannomutase n=1 Tax=Marinospirillum alkaliphilum DSM 21637 TaxID=1122209 RepID=A0A1K1W7S8_9GAMM|nr:phosphomannomutase/phosphoglucomutase [Marinospirillum alkaliphilum]SFX32869.1 phosphomannomutase / phosphoglucomutase [Marinospirillum alkaliphilum DSM 21637]
MTDVPASIFRAYDIRGIVGKTLTPEIVHQIGLALGSEAAARGETAVVVARDGRVSGPEMITALKKGLTETGRDVIDIGMVPTPTLYYAAKKIAGTQSGIMVTGSHNPPDYNGFKCVLGGETLSGAAITDLYRRIQASDFKYGVGFEKAADVREDYLKAILESVQLKRPLKVVVDTGNGVAGELAPRLMQELGCEVIPLFTEIDGTFPNHHPDPGKPENLKDLIASVQANEADLGLGFDGDGDRVGVITPSGTLIYPDHLMMAFAEDLLSRNPGAKIIYDVKCTGNLGKVIAAAGGQPEMWQTGHSLIKARMKETGALLAGEMSGHIFFSERWLGFDDGLYAAARLLEILSAQEQNADAFFSRYPQDLSTPEINVTVTDENKFDLVQRLANEGQFGDGQKTTLDGIRVDYEDGWGLCRASNTTPVLVLRFEGRTPEALERISSTFRSALQQVDASLALDF